MKKRKQKLLYAAPLLLGLLLTSENALAIPAKSLAAKHSTVQKTNQVTGIVTDKNGDPLIGVSVLEKGNERNGVISNADGRFSLNAPANAVLLVSYIGYKSVEIPVNGQTILKITLQENSKDLNEIVVIGYGSVRKADLTGSVSVMNSKAFRDQPITQVSDALQGRMSGVNVISDGIPGGAVKIRVRGTNSINKSNEPLYVVDGMVRESGLEGINPEDIKSMQVLKDASSTAIYGSRGANGVVIITTKGGTKGQSNITFDAAVGVSNATRLPKMMDTKSYAQALIDYAGINENDVKQYLDGTKPGIDWVDTMFRTALTQNYKLVLSKGAEGLQSYISANYMKNEGLLDKSSYERYAAKINLKASMTKWLDVTFDVNASRGIRKGIGELVMAGYNPLWIAFNSSPTMEMKDKMAIITTTHTVRYRTMLTA